MTSSLANPGPSVYQRKRKTRQGLRRALRNRIETYRNNVTLFAKEVFNVTLDRQQARVTESLVVPGSRVSVTSGHGTGKTFLEAVCAWWHVICFPDGWVMATAPTARQLREQLWGNMRKFHSQMTPFWKARTKIVQDEAFVVGLRSRQRATCRTSRRDEPEALAGVHDKNVLLIVDEASGVHEKVFETGRGSLSTSGARVLMCSNPTRNNGFFYDSHHKNRSRWSTHHLSCFDSSYVSDDWIEEMRVDYGEDSIVYAVRVRGVFPLASADILIPLDLIERAQARKSKIAKKARRAAGLDVARQGDDFSALAVRQGTALTYLDRWIGNDTVETANRTIYAYNRGLFDAVAVDIIGVGAGSYDTLYHAAIPSIAVNVACRAHDSARFGSLRDEIWWRLREWFEDPDCSIPSDAECPLIKKFIEEITPVTYKFTGGRIKVASKDEIKEVLHRSPDMGDAVCNTFAADLGMDIRSFSSDTSAKVKPGSGSSSAGKRKEKATKSTKKMPEASSVDWINSLSM